jgi:hypothetical protein
MAYLGNSPVLSQQEYRNIDNISASFNGVTTSFPLLVNGVAPVPAPQSSNQCLISVNGVVQKPDDTGASGFRLSGGNIVFSAAPTGGQSFFGVILAGADYIYAGSNFPDGTVSAPSITFAQDLDTGFYRSGAGEVKFTANGTNVVTLSANNLTAPSFIPTGSSAPTNGVYLPSANNVAISTNGSGRLFVDSSGRIGIQDSAPSTSDVRSANVVIGGATSDGIGVKGRKDSLDRWYVGYNSSDHLEINQIRNNQLVFKANNTEYARITNDGKLGLGTSSPSYTLDVSGTARITSVSPLWLGTTTGDSYIQYGANATTTNNWTVGSQADGTFRFFNGTYASGTERLRITSAGNVGIGTQTPQALTEISSTSAEQKLWLSKANSGTANEHGMWLQFANYGPAATARTGDTIIGKIHFYGSQPTSGNLQDCAAIECRADGNQSGGQTPSYLSFKTTATNVALERARIDSSGRLLVGTSSASFSTTVKLQANSGSATGESRIRFCRGEATPANGATLGIVGFSDNTETPSAEIAAQRDGGTWSASSVPGRLVFSTTANGASSPTERMRIDSDGNLHIAKTTGSLNTVGHTFYPAGLAEFVRSGGTALNVNRLASDGGLVDFYQDSALEGNISVSGTTVFFNGAHLARWSQLANGAQRVDILRGSVLSNLDEMCEWGEEANEQLNRMKISDVDGDPNVAGVFISWDDDDDTYTDDFYCAMTGDFIIRIAEGVTVQRGDLLMSAGDGTAKPQDDDIIRSKTVAKVTSTHVTCTYEDGSYCVPCVLMAC